MGGYVQIPIHQQLLFSFQDGDAARMQARASALLGALGHVTGEVMVQGIEAAGDPEALSLLVRNGCVRCPGL